MSYVLNALKKSAKKRRHDKNHRYDFIHDPLPRPRSHGLSAPWKKNMFVVLLIIISISLGTWLYFSVQPAVTPQKTVQTTPRVSTVKLSELTISPLSWTDKDAPPQKPQQSSPQKIQDRTPLSNEPASLNHKAQPQQANENPIAAKQPVVTKEKFPNLQFAGHAYSTNPAKRMIIINNSILREGDRINSQLRLMEITPDGVILEQDGQKFNVNLE